MLKPYDVEQAAAELSEVPMTQKSTRTPRKPKVKKLFVVDTNVLMHDPTSLFRFEEHDVYLPIGTLEELDANKKGLSDVSRNARQASRFLDEIVTGDDIKHGLAIKTKDGQAAKGRLFLQTEAINGDLPTTLASGKTDNQILAVVRFLVRDEFLHRGDGGSADGKRRVAFLPVEGRKILGFGDPKRRAFFEFAHEVGHAMRRF